MFVKTFSIPVVRPVKFGASAADIASVSRELGARIGARLVSVKPDGSSMPGEARASASAPARPEPSVAPRPAPAAPLHGKR
jgi:hypothetical protein